MTKLEFMALPLPRSVTLAKCCLASTPLKTISGHAGVIVLGRLQTAIEGPGNSPLLTVCISKRMGSAAACTAVSAIPCKPMLTSHCVKATGAASLETAWNVLLLRLMQYEPQLAAIVLREPQSDDILKRHPYFICSIS